MAPMELRSIPAWPTGPDPVDTTWERMPVGAPPEAARSGMDFAANADRRWAPSWQAFQRELAHMTDRLEELVAAGIHRLPEEFSDGEQFTQGVKKAAAWTLGTEAFPPLSGREPAAVSDAGVARVLAQAERVIAAQPQIRWYAEGVRSWLRWITGEQPGIAYPPA